MLTFEHDIKSPAAPEVYCSWHTPPDRLMNQLTQEKIQFSFQGGSIKLLYYVALDKRPCHLAQ